MKLRGPFPSLSAFVNRLRSAEFLLVDRNLSADDLVQAQRAGALATALRESGINSGFESEPTMQIKPEDYDSRLPFRQAVEGTVHHGVAGFLTQADLLRKLGPLMTARSDTFKIRGYGEAQSSSGTVSARAYCEVVVRRSPEYVIDAEAGGNIPTEEGLDLVELNQRFGRRFEIVSFRWLSEDSL